MGSPPARGPEDYFAPGDFNILCSICGTKLKFSEAERNWQGMYRHSKCNEPRHPQDFVHSINAPEMVVPIVQKMAEIDVQICTFNGISAIPGYAIPGCSIPGRSLVDPLNPPSQLG